FPAFRLVEFNREEDERAPPPVPACLLEISEMPTDNERDPGTGQTAFNLRVEARVVMGFREPQAKLAVRKLSAALAVWLRRRRFAPSGPAEVLGAFRDEFSPALDQFEVWRVEWDQV